MTTLVVVPTINEAPTIQKVISGVRSATAHVLVVDDGSTDGTIEAVDSMAAMDPGVHLMARGHRLGLGSAYRDGLTWALDRGYDVLGEMDADLSHDPADLPRLIAGLADADLVIGSRYVAGGDVVDWPLSRRLLSRGGNGYVRIWTGLPVNDATAGYRVYRRAVLERLDLGSIRSDGYAFQVEMALRTWWSGGRVAEVPITFTERRAGSSKMSRSIVAEALWRVPLWGVSGRRGTRDTAS